MSQPLTLACFAAKGGQGTTVTAACIALAHAEAGRRTLLIDAAADHDAPAVLGYPEPVDRHRATEIAAHLHLAAADGPDHPVDLDVAAYDVVVVDAGRRRPPVGSAILVTRSCYVALRRALEVAPAPDGVIVVVEPGRALAAADVAAVLGRPVVAVLPVDPSVARTVDAGLLAHRFPPVLAPHRPALLALGAAHPA